MSDLKSQLTDQIKTFMKAGEKQKLQYARNLHAAIKKKEVDDRVDVDDEAFLKIVQTNVKQRNDAIEQFKQGGRDDLVANESAERDFLMTFMPAQLSDDELEKLVADAVAESGASEPKDMGKVMKVLLPKVQGKADGKRVSTAVKNKLQG